MSSVPASRRLFGSNPTGVESRLTASLPKLSDMNLVALEPESGHQIQDVVGLTASLDCVSSDKCI